MNSEDERIMIMEGAAKINELLAENARLREATQIAAEFIEGHVDVIDGDDGAQLPNEAMVIMREIDEALEKVK